MDGILVSSMDCIERCWTQWAVSRGVDPELACSTIHGRRAIDAVRILCPERDAEAEFKVIEDLEVADHEGITVLPGVLDLLAALPNDCWTVVTSSTDRLARVRLAAGGIPAPRRIIAGEHVVQGKPHPEPYLAGAAMLGFAPQECVVIEDSSSGAKAGRDAGCTVVATTFSHPADSLDAADYLVTDLTGMRVNVLPAGEGLELSFAPLAVQAQQD